ncbi:MAG: hypothetical protein IJH50_06890 [Kiritimatiellae bacterium]|nr:hypothetical protein [Kiritimatiellia bacterium]
MRNFFIVLSSLASRLKNGRYPLQRPDLSADGATPSLTLAASTGSGLDGVFPLPSSPLAMESTSA